MKKIFYKEYGPNIAQQFIDNIQFIANAWMMRHGFSIGISDLITDEDTSAKLKIIVNDMKKEGDILVYNIGFEKGRLNALIHSFPEYQNDLQSIIDRMKDLIIPFREKWYYDPVMKGSYSIKDVLPALVHGLSYDNLEINNGSLASAVFTNLTSKNDKVEIQKIRENLLAYCKLDTYAMVKILEVLKSISCS